MGKNVGLPQGSIEKYIKFKGFIADQFSQDSNESFLQRIQLEIDEKKLITRNLYENGGRILLGTDANDPFIVPAFSIHDELNNLVEAGLHPMKL